MPRYSIKIFDIHAWLDEAYNLFMSSYRVEADILGIKDFPPLERPKEDLLTCGNQFLGCFEEDVLRGVLELELAPNSRPTIASLAVKPKNFRCGIGTAIVKASIENLDTQVKVATGEKNQPGLRLYEKLGFKEHRRFQTPDGVSMIELSTQRVT